MALKSKFLRTNVLKSRGMRQHYHGFLPVIPLKIYLFKVQSSFVRINLFRFRSCKNAVILCVLQGFATRKGANLSEKPINP